MRWIKISAWIGFSLFIIGCISFLISLIGSFSGDNGGATASSQNNSSIFLIIILFLIFFGIAFFFYFGFVKVGENVKSRLMRISSWLIISGIFLIGILTISSFSLTKSSSNQQIQPPTGEEYSNFNFSSFNDGFTDNQVQNSFLTGGAISSLTSYTSLATGWLILFIFGLLFLLVSLILFFVSLAEVNKEVKYSRPSSVFGLLTLCSFFIFLALLGIFVLIFLFRSPPVWTKLILKLPGLIALIALLFESLFLFDASKKFETDDLSPTKTLTNPQTTSE